MTRTEYTRPEINIVAFPQICENTATGSTFDENGKNYNDPIEHGDNNSSDDEGGARGTNLWDSWADDGDDEW